MHEPRHAQTGHTWHKFELSGPFSGLPYEFHTPGTQNKVTGGICAFHCPYTQTAPAPAQSGERHDVCIPRQPTTRGECYTALTMESEV